MISIYKIAYWRTRDNGPGCQLNEEVTNIGDCAKAAKHLGYSGDVRSSNYNHAPKGCFVGHKNDNWKYTYLNNINGQTGDEQYRSICKIQKGGKR